MDRGTRVVHGGTRVVHGGMRVVHGGTRIMHGGMRVVHGLRVQWRNTRQVVAGARKWSYEARMGATGCDGLGVM